MALKRVDSITRRVQRDVHDMDETNILKVDIYDAMNQVETDICRRGLALKVRSTITLVTGQQAYALASPYYKMRVLIPPTTWRRKLEIITDPQRWSNIISSPEWPNLGGIFYVFTVSGITTSPVANDTYSNNNVTFTVYSTTLTGAPGSISGTIVMTATNAPTSNGNLTKVTGNGDATIAFSSVSQGLDGLQPLYCYFWGQQMEVWPLPTTGDTITTEYYGLPTTALAAGVDPEVDSAWDKALEYGTADYVLPGCQDGSGATFAARYEAELRKIGNQEKNETTMPMRKSSWADDLEEEIFG